MSSNANPPVWDDAAHAASLIGKKLIASGQRLVLAESCTSGLMAATIAGLPGVSAAFCGSAVTYRDATKRDWLGLDQGLLDDASAVSASVTRQMALSVLERTAEADWSLAITGHLGPGAPQELDGQVFVSLAFVDRTSDASPLFRTVSEHAGKLDWVTRQDRQFEACITAWKWIATAI